MRRVVLLSVLFLGLHGAIGQNNLSRSQKPGPMFQSFLMTVTEDGKSIPDHFELWELWGDFSGITSTCNIQVASFSLLEKTHVHLWNHVAERVTEVRPGIFKAEMNGRLNQFSGLEVIIELNRDRSQVVAVNGSTRSGTKGQSVRLFQVDRKSEDRKLHPLFNPSWMLETK